MRIWTLPLFALIAGCPNPYKYDTADTTDTDSADADTDTDADSDADADADSDADSDADTDADPNCHPYEPLSNTGWTKTFNVTYNGATGTETQTGYGLYNGFMTIDDKLTAGTNGWDGFATYSCDTNGAYVNGFNGSFGTQQGVTTNDSPPRKFLPGPDAVGDNMATWTYNYNMQVTNAQSTTPMAVGTTGTYTNYGFVASKTVAAGTFTDVLWIHNEYTQTPDQSLAQYIPQVSAKSDLYYAPGVGLISETTTNSATNDVIMQKELTAKSGL